MRQRIVKPIISVALLIAAPMFATHSHADANNPKESPSYNYISCSMMTAEYLTTLQLYQRGISEEQALKEIPFSSRGAKERLQQIYQLARSESILDSYSFINTNFARCAKQAHKTFGIPAKDTVDYGYYFCAGENKIRYEIILHINASFDLDKVLSQTPDTHLDTAISYYNLIKEKGILAAFDYTANNFKACLKRL